MVRAHNCSDAVGGQCRPGERNPMNELRIALIIFGLSISAASAQDSAAGAISFGRCLGCHAIGVGAKNRIGPQLNGIEGRKCGNVEGYSYSAANKDCAFSWNEAVLWSTSGIPKRKCRAPKNPFPASGTKPRPGIYGPISVSSDPTAGRNDSEAGIFRRFAPQSAAA